MRPDLAGFIFTGLFIILSFTPTRQDEIRTIRNNQFYPTNSIYGAPLLRQNRNIVVESNGNPVNYEETIKDIDKASEEIDYGEEYAADTTQEAGEIHSSQSSLQNSSVDNTHYKTKEEDPNIHADYYYYYDDDYDNATNLHHSEYEDYTSSNESTAVIVSHDNSSSLVLKNDKLTLSKEIDEEAINSDERILIGEAIVSVVTTKSVVNGTISIPTYPPMTTEQMDVPPISHQTSPSPPSHEETTTEDSIIVASVQTSRSISGARFLPFDFVSEPPKSSSNTTEESSTRKSQIESTESIIDKLDRVQSELSSGFLTSGFRNSGNALQLDVLSEQRPMPTRKVFTTTGRTPIISKFVPKRFNDRKITVTTSTEKEITDIEQQPENEEKSKISFRWPSSSRSKALTTESVRTPSKPTTPRIKVQVPDISAFLPPGFKLNEQDKATEKSLLSDILSVTKFNTSSASRPSSKSKQTTQNALSTNATTEAPNDPLQSLLQKSSVDISAFLPPGYKKKEEVKLMTTTTTTTLSPIQKSLQDLFSKTSSEISGLLPAGYEEKGRNETTSQSSNINSNSDSNSKTALESTTKSGGIKLVFPSRPGGRKAIQKGVTVHGRGNNDAPTAVTPKIQKGWPTRATTEFTGWPTPSTTPISIEKLLEAARTATVSSVNSSMVPITSEVSTTPSTTTTTTTVRPTTPGYCDDECEVAGTIRIIGNTTWVPELFDRNTNEWQELADLVEKEINLVYVKSAILRKWYKNVRIDAFSPGSILVDYFVELQDLSQRINTQELKVLFHDSLRTYNAHKWNETRTTKAPMRLGNFLIDPKSTDFVVIPKLSLPQHIERDDRLIPQWAIAVIVIGVGGLLFIIVFGVSVLVNRQNTAKLKPPVSGMYTEEAAKNIIQASQAATSHRSSHDYPKSEISTIWNDTEAWKEKSFESNSNKILVDGMLQDEKKYNVYDSWRSEWNGYYYQPSHSSKFTGYESTAYSRHPPDYDTNF